MGCQRRCPANQTASLLSQGWTWRRCSLVHADCLGPHLAPSEQDPPASPGLSNPSSSTRLSIFICRHLSRRSASFSFALSSALLRLRSCLHRTRLLDFPAPVCNQASKAGSGRHARQKVAKLLCNATIPMTPAMKSEGVRVCCQGGQAKCAAHLVASAAAAFSLAPCGSRSTASSAR